MKAAATWAAILVVVASGAWAADTATPQAEAVPTFAEAGLPDFETLAWFGLFAPAKTPMPIVRRLHGEIVKALAQPDVRERLEALGAIPVGNTPEEFAAQIKATIDVQVKVARVGNIRAE